MDFKIEFQVLHADAVVVVWLVWPLGWRSVFKYKLLLYFSKVCHWSAACWMPPSPLLLQQLTLLLLSERCSPGRPPWSSAWSESLAPSHLILRAAVRPVPTERGNQHGVLAPTVSLNKQRDIYFWISLTYNMLQFKGACLVFNLIYALKVQYQCDV